MNKNSRIFIAGAGGLVGSAIVLKLKQDGYTNLLTVGSRFLDLTDKYKTLSWFKTHRPEYVFLAAAKVGGILANSTYPVDFLFQNLRIQDNVLRAAAQIQAKVLFLGSSCIYPKMAPQPIKEEYLLSGPLEQSNIAYAIAKIAGIVGCQAYAKQHNCNFISCMPTNLYGPGDNFDLNNSHVLPALLRKFHEALPDKPVTIWGTGSPRREFLHVADLAAACVTLMENYNSQEPVNIGTGVDVTIEELARIIQKVTGHKGDLVWDTDKPDGTPRKLLDISKIKRLGWTPEISLEDGIRSTYEWYKTTCTKNK